MLIYIVGFAAGLIGGMGIGGGTILIPALVFFVGVNQQIAQSVNLLSFIPAAIIAIFVHIRKKNIECRLVLKLVLLGCIGAITGSFFAVMINPKILKKVFGVFLLIMGIREIMAKGDVKKT